MLYKMRRATSEEKAMPQHKIDLVPILRAHAGYFRHLDVVTGLADPKTRGQMEEEAFRHVTACGYTEDGTLNAHGLIQLCLLSTELFQCPGAFAPGAAKILALHRPEWQQRTCKDRPKLIETLATLLLEYDYHCAYLDIGRPQFRRYRTQREFRHLRQTPCAFLRLREKEGFATDPDLKYIHCSTLKDACATIARVVEALTPEDYEFMLAEELQGLTVLGGYAEYNPLTQTFVAPATFERDLLPAMYRAFEDYGPSSKYPKQAVDHALAAISLQFALESGDRLRVAERLRRRRDRAQA
jgi:hypothetical protein